MQALVNLSGSNSNLPEFTPEFIYGKENNNPRDSYVYGHYDQDGKIFYVGKGVSKRAWNITDRHPIWGRYVSKNLNGKYQIRIIEDDLTNEDAEYLEGRIMEEYAEQLVNWINWGRKSDFAAIHYFHKLRNANRLLIMQAKLIENTDINLSIKQYRLALEQIKEYVFIQFEPGLLGKIMKEDKDDLGYSGELEALDRLTFCLCKQGKALEALEVSSNYFKTYKRDTTRGVAGRIIQRIKKKIGKSLIQ